MNTILSNPIAYAIMASLEQIRGERYPQFFITAAYITCANEYPLLADNDNAIAYHMELQAVNTRRAELFKGILLGYDMGVGKRSIVAIIKDDAKRAI